MILLRKFFIYFFITILVATGLTYASFLIFEEVAYVKNDIWRTLSSPGDKDRNMYTRLAVSQFGTFALAKPEAAYFHAFTDISDEELNSKCMYKVAGEDIDARWWALTVYDNDGFLIENTEKNYSFNSENVNFNLDGGFEIYLTNNNQAVQEVASSNWLRSPQSGNFSVSLRIYLPGEEFFSNLRRVNLPIIEKIECFE